MLGTYQTHKYGFIVLEKAVHGNAGAYIRAKKVEVKVKMRWALQIAQAMAFLHYHSHNE